MRFFLALMIVPVSLLADGGVILLHQQSAPYVMTVFASPNPPRAGLIDLSVLVQSGETMEPVLDGEVSFDLAKDGSLIHVHATRAQAQNKLLYAAAAHLRDPGNWRLTVTVRRKQTSVTVSGNLTIGPEQPGLSAYRSDIALPFFCLAIFLLNQWLARGMRLRTARSR